MGEEGGALFFLEDMFSMNGVKRGTVALLPGRRYEIALGSTFAVGDVVLRLQAVQPADGFPRPSMYLSARILYLRKQWAK